MKCNIFKFFAYLIFPVFLIIFFSVSSLADTSAKAVIDYGFYDEKQDGFCLKYHINDTSEGTVVVAAYDDTGRLIAISTKEISQNIGETHETILKMPIELLEKAYIDIFVWNNLNTMRPITKAVAVKLCEISSKSPKPINTYIDFSAEPYVSLNSITQNKTVGDVAFIFNPTIQNEGAMEVKNNRLDIGWIGNKEHCSVKIRVKENCRILLYAKSRSSNEPRTLTICDENKTELASSEFASDKITVKTFDYNGDESNIYIYPKKGAVYIYRIEILYTYTNKDGIYEAEDFLGIKAALIRAAQNGGGTIVINADKVDCTSIIELDMENSNITLTRGEGYDGILDFALLRDTGAIEDSIWKQGIYIRGSGYTIKDLIIQNVPGTGVKLLGEKACNNIMENLILRYNDGKGIGISGKASNNTVKNCYAYRNCDVVTCGNNGDGFTIPANAGPGNKLINCFAWENSDDGFDLFGTYEEVKIENCYAWHNGDPNVYTGKYDYDNEKPLDEQLHLVKLFMQYDQNFKTNYENGNFKLPEGKFIMVAPDNSHCQKEDLYETTAEDFIGNHWSGNPNGFKLGSGDSMFGPKLDYNVKRYMKNCVVFDHNDKGFDKNNAAFSFEIENGFAFDNRRANYSLDGCEINKFLNVFSADGIDYLPQGLNTNTLTEEQFTAVKKEIYKDVETINKTVNLNQIPHIDVERIFRYLPIRPENQYYNFSDDIFKSLGKITETVSIGGLTFNNEIDKDDFNIDETKGCLNMGRWTGNNENCAVKLHVFGDCHIIISARSRSAEQARTLIINNSDGTGIAEIEFPPKIVTGLSYDYKGGETDLYFTTKNGPILLYSIEVIYNYKKDNTKYHVTNYNNLKKSIKNAEQNGGGTIYINSNFIECDAPVELSADNANLTICAGKGFYPVLDFLNSYNENIPPNQNKWINGIKITGNNYTIKNLTIHHAPGNGIRLEGDKSHNNLIENIVSAYNSGSGISMTFNAYDNTAKNCYAYRNCDILTIGENADGFSIANGTGKGSKLINCYSWDNADDGYDLFRNYNDVTFENCFAWHNGYGEVYTGRYDFNNKEPLDENLKIVKMIQEHDPEFKTKYENGIFELTDEKFITVAPGNGQTDIEYLFDISPKEFEKREGQDEGKWCGNSNAFKLGSGATSNGDPQVTENAVRRMTNCICFDHEHKGFDKNNAACTIYINNSLAFDNRRLNYQLDLCTVNEFNNSYIYGGKYKLPNSLFPAELTNEQYTAVKAKIENEIKNIKKALRENKIPNAHMEEVFNLM